MTAPQIVILGALAALLSLAAIGDIRSRIIPNWLNLAVALLAISWWCVCRYDLTAISIQIGVAFAALILFGACFSLGAMGGGDVKLIVALSLFLTPDRLVTMLVWMAICGGILTLLMLAIHAIRQAAGRPEVPYGVAIVTATMLCVANDILTTSMA